MFDFETHSCWLERGKTTWLVLAGTLSVATCKMSRDMKPTIGALHIVIYDIFSVCAEF
jgi:hypothetical protein